MRPFPRNFRRRKRRSPSHRRESGKRVRSPDADSANTAPKARTNRGKERSFLLFFVQFVHLFHELVEHLF